MHVQNDMNVIAHDRKCVNPGRENVTQFQNTRRGQPRLAMFKIFVGVRIESTQPRPAHAAANQVEKLRLSGVRSVFLAALPSDRTNAERLCRRPEPTS